MHLFFKRLSVFFKYKDLLKQLVSKDLKLKYRRSFLGYLWSVLNPLLIMCVMAVVFTQMFNRGLEHFPIYLFCGQIIFNFMSQSTKQAMKSITGNAALLKKTYVPKYIFTFSKITSGLVDLVLSMGALIIIIIVTGGGFSWHFLLFPLVLVQLYAFCLGLGLFLAQANVFFRDIEYIYNAVITAWLYLSAIFYPVTSLPDNVRWFVEHCNPLYYYIAQFRALIYAHTLPDTFFVVAGTVGALVVLCIGTFFFQRKQNRFILFI